MVWSFSNTIIFMAGPCSPKHGPVSFTMLNNFFCLDVMQPFKNHSSLWLGRAPHHPLVTAQLISQRWGIISFWCFADCQQPSNQRLVVLPQTRSSSFHGVKQFFVWMVWNFSKAFEVMVGPCSPKHGPVPFTVLKNLFVWMLCSHLKTSKFMIWLRSPTSFATAQLVSRRWTIFS